MKNSLNTYEKVAIGLIGGWILLSVIGTLINSGAFEIIQLIISVGAGAACGVYLYRKRSFNVKMLRHVSGRLSPLERHNLDIFPMPAVVMDSAMNVRWYNRVAASTFFSGDKLNANMKEILRGYSSDWEDITCQSVNVNGIGYTVYASEFTVQGEQLYALYFHNDDELKKINAEYYNSRPVVMIITIDNYEEILREARDLEKTKIVAAVEETILRWATRTTGMLLRYDRERYIFTVEERDFRRLKDDKFDILDDVRKQVRPDGSYPTLSIGIGHGFDTFREGEKAARQALDMALGRGGDQAAVCNQGNENSYEFYGGVTKGIERNSKVRSRVVAASLEPMIKQASNVLVVGHARSDMDSVGAAVGIQFIAVGLGKEAKVVINRETSLAETLINYIENAGLDIFVTPAQAKKYLTSETLVIVVDNQKILTVDAPEIVEAASSLVIIDHHRRAADCIQNPALLFNEPNSSSTCEMVVELVQYMSCGKPNKVQSEALLSGIMLDTKTFTSNAGVRTFEAAAYLRRRGVDTSIVKQLFAEPFDTYALKNKFLGNLIKYHNAVIAVLPTPTNLQYVNKSASIAADEVAAIEKVDAAFAVYSTGEQSVICARSAGALNVQLVMEKLGGGGHHNMAGAQIKNSTVEETVNRLKYAIDRVLIDLKQQNDQ